LSDVDTRRRAACDLVQALTKVVEGPVIQNFSQYVQALLAVCIKSCGLFQQKHPPFCHSYQSCLSSITSFHVFTSSRTKVSNPRFAQWQEYQTQNLTE